MIQGTRFHSFVHSFIQSGLDAHLPPGTVLAPWPGLRPWTLHVALHRRNPPEDTPRAPRLQYKFPHKPVLTAVIGLPGREGQLQGTRKGVKATSLSGRGASPAISGTSPEAHSSRKDLVTPKKRRGRLFSAVLILCKERDTFQLRHFITRAQRAKPSLVKWNQLLRTLSAPPRKSMATWEPVKLA